MSILVYRDKDLAGAAAATLIAAQIIEEPRSVLGFDCSAELRPVYRALAKMTGDGLLDWSDVSVFSLYEHVRPAAGRSVAARMDADLFSNVNIDREKLFFPESAPTDWSVSCAAYESRISEAGGLDMVFVSIGPDGSIVFNSGASELAPVTHAESSGRVVTVGMKTLMSAKKVVACLTGKDKSMAAGAIFNGPVSPQVPASYLQLHRGAVFILDEDAAGAL